MKLFRFIDWKIKRLERAIAQRISRLPVVYLKESKRIGKKPLIKNIKKILIVAHSPSDSLMESSISNVFKELGYYCEIFQVRGLTMMERGSYSLRRTVDYYSQVDLGHWLLNRRLFKKVRNEKFDLVFILESNWVVLPETIIAIKNETDALVILWETNIHIWNRHQSDCLALYDVVFFLDSYFVPIWKTANVKKAFYLPCCVDEKLNARPEISEKDRNHYKCDLGFVGRLYRDRVEIFEELTHYDLKIYGPVLPEVPISENLKSKIISETITIEEKRKFYNIAKIILNIEADYLHINSPSIRLFEVALCGGFPLVKYQRDLEDMFELGQELICFYDVNDLMEKINYYISHLEDKEKIIRRCKERILKEHTVKIRMKQMLDILRH